VPEDYVHRIGRTGRAGASGEAISLVCVDEKQFLADIERLIKRQIPLEVVAGFEPDPNARPEPILLRSQGRGGQRNGSQRNSSHAGARNTGARTRNGSGQPQPNASRSRTKPGQPRSNGRAAASGDSVGNSLAAKPVIEKNGNVIPPPPRGNEVNGNTFATTKPAPRHRMGGRGR